LFVLVEHMLCSWKSTSARYFWDPTYSA